MFERVRNYITKKTKITEGQEKPSPGEVVAQAKLPAEEGIPDSGLSLSRANLDASSNDYYPKGEPSGEVTLSNPEGIVTNLHQETEVRRSVLNTIRKVHARLLDPISGRLDPPTKKNLLLMEV